MVKSFKIHLIKHVTLQYGIITTQHNERNGVKYLPKPPHCKRPEEMINVTSIIHFDKEAFIDLYYYDIYTIIGSIFTTTVFNVILNAWGKWDIL